MLKPSGHRPTKGQLPGSAPPDEDGDLAGLDGDGDVAQHRPLEVAFPVGVADVLELDGGRAHSRAIVPPEAASSAHPTVAWHSCGSVT